MEAPGLVQPVDLEDNLLGSLRRSLFFRIELVDHPSDHGVDHIARLDIGEFVGDDILAVAKHGNTITIVEDFSHAVRDIDDRYPAIGETPHDRKQYLRLGFRQRRGRLVQDQHPAIQRQGLGDFHQLLAGDRQIAHQGGGIDVGQFLKNNLRLFPQAIIIHQK